MNEIRLCPNCGARIDDGRHKMLAAWHPTRPNEAASRWGCPEPARLRTLAQVLEAEAEQR